LPFKEIGPCIEVDGNSLKVGPLGKNRHEWDDDIKIILN
jgi:hypothetical protein